MFRFFVNENFDEKIKLNKEDSHHYLNVARIKADEDVEIIADNGYFIGRFLCEKDGFVYIKKIKEINSSNESDVKLCLAFGILKNNNTEEILKYCTEIGVSEFLPLYTKRVVSNIKAKEKNKIERWQRIVESAAKQSKRNVIPTIHKPVDIMDLEKYKDDKKIYLAYENEDNNKFDGSCKDKNIMLVIGPEGGFERSEVDYIKSIGAEIISLGDRILRAQTAAICSSFYIINLLEGR